jgi:hypothetical protein
MCSDIGKKNIKAAQAALTPEILSASGKKTGPENIKAAQAALTPEILSENGKKQAAANFTPEVRSGNGKKAGPANGKKTGSNNGKVRSKRLLLTKIATGETFEFPSTHEAARALGLSQGCLSGVARGERKQHKGYTAVYHCEGVYKLPPGC